MYFIPNKQLNHLLVAFFICFLMPIAGSAQVFKTFKRGLKAERAGDYKTAETIFRKKQHHRIWGPAADVYLEKIKSRRSQSIYAWAKADSIICARSKSIESAKGRQKRKFNKRGVTPAKLNGMRTNLESTALRFVADSMDIFLLDSLLDHFPCWQPQLKDDRDTLRQNVVNKAVYSFDYDVATDIIHRHLDWVQPAHIEAAWTQQDSIWVLYKGKYDLCLMDKFRSDHPLNPYSRDCWFDEAKAVFCSKSLDAALDFHNQNRFTVFEYEIAQGVINWVTPAQKAALSPQERTHVDDILLLYQLRLQVYGCAVIFDSLQLRQKIAYYSGKYAPRRTAFELVEDGVDYFLSERNLYSAKTLVNTLEPIFPDSLSCEETFDFVYQTNKQNWFKKYKKYLDIAEEDLSNNPMLVWNTPDNWEFSAASYSGGTEVFFARMNPKTKDVKVMTSLFQEGKWSKPTPVNELSGSRRAIPLSLTADGLTMLLSINQSLYMAFRRDTALSWMAPVRVSMSKLPYIGRASIAPDGRSIVLDGSEVAGTARKRPKPNLFFCDRRKNGSYSDPEPLTSLNSDVYSERNPIFCGDGYSILYSSDDPDGFGGLDVYSTSRKDNKKWAKWTEPDNMGWRVNTLFDDGGFSFVPDYGGDAYYARTHRCTKDRDIWRIDLPARVWPKGTVRFAGIVTDRKGKGYSGGFMEITLNDRKAPVWVAINPGTGSYSYKPPAGTKIIRLYPNVPGFLTTIDSVHTLSKYKEGALVRDTFRLMSFEEVRTEYQLQYANFEDNQSVLSDPRIYAELNQLRFIAERMGASLQFIGHTDSSGTESHNQYLALDRAVAIQRYMVSNCGFPAEKITVSSFGATKPKCPNSTDEGRRCNRRVEVVFVMPRPDADVSGVPMPAVPPPSEGKPVEKGPRE